ncbi:HipA domain-containing protein [Sulfurimonas sp.]|uniref:type II toxin-antitoxin system HipA family toxin n=1 Tax=Sulfurimonas sp. TaxID=2022749 RepID=UPI00345640D7
MLAIGGSSAGAKPKIIVQINDTDEIIHGSQQLQKGYKHFIVKFPSANDAQEIGKLEYIYSQMAHNAKIDIPTTKLLRTQRNSYFATKRFDRNKDARVDIHLVHSDFRLPSLDYDDLLSLALHLTKDMNEALKMFRLACFNLFTHNRDNHAKNFSYMLDENSR